MEAKRSRTEAQLASEYRNEPQLVEELRNELSITKNYFYGTLAWAAALSVGILAMLFEFTQHLL